MNTQILFLMGFRYYGLVSDPDETFLKVLNKLLSFSSFPDLNIFEKYRWAHEHATLSSYATVAWFRIRMKFFSKYLPIYFLFHLVRIQIFVLRGTARLMNSQILVLMQLRPGFGSGWNFSQSTYQSTFFFILSGSRYIFWEITPTLSVTEMV